MPRTMTPKDQRFDVRIDPQAPLFVIGVVSEMVQIPIWTLRKLYNFERSELQNLLEQLLSASTFCFENREVVTQASALFQSSTADFSDCLIVAQNSALGCEATVTFDKAMGSLPSVELLNAKR